MPKLTEDVLTELRTALPTTARACVKAIVREVPGYDRDFDRILRANIQGAVQQALGAYVESHSPGGDKRAVEAMTHGAYRLGFGEASSGRSMDALLAAYRVGARVAWDMFAETLIATKQPSALVAQMASETFAYIDRLSGASLAGHTAALTQRTQEIARRRDQLAAALAAGEPVSSLEALAETAHWPTPQTLCALVLDGTPSPALETLLGERTLWASGGTNGSIALIPDLPAKKRDAVLTACGPHSAALGPATAWTSANESIRRAQRAKSLSSGTVDTEDRLPDILLAADPFVAGLLRDKAMAPLRELTDVKQQVNAETLLSWLLHQGRREDVAAQLHVHPQTVRYRMNQLRELYGERLNDPRSVLELIVGLTIASDEALAPLGGGE